MTLIDNNLNSLLDEEFLTAKQACEITRKVNSETVFDKERKALLKTILKRVEEDAHFGRNDSYTSCPEKEGITQKEINWVKKKLTELGYNVKTHTAKFENFNKINVWHFVVE